MTKHADPKTILRFLTIVAVISLLVLSGAGPLAAAEKKKKSRKNFIPSQSVTNKHINIHE